MKNLPNGVQIFNATSHPITFWDGEWEEPVSVDVDKVISAMPIEKTAYTENEVEYVITVFQGTDEGRGIIERVKADNPDAIIVGSIIAAQAHPGDVVSMVPHPDYMRVPPAEKRMLPNKFNVFNGSK